MIDRRTKPDLAFQRGILAAHLPLKTLFDDVVDPEIYDMTEIRTAGWPTQADYRRLDARSCHERASRRRFARLYFSVVSVEVAVILSIAVLMLSCLPRPLP